MPLKQVVWVRIPEGPPFFEVYMKARYIKNIGSFITGDIQEKIFNKKIAIIGCGGNGEYVVEFLARLGIQEMSIWDGDIFMPSNINRQCMMTETDVGQSKTVITSKRLLAINSNLKLHCYSFLGDATDDFEHLLEHDLIVWCADNSKHCLLARSRVRNAIMQGIPCIDAGLYEEGGNIYFITKDNIAAYDKQTDIWCDHTQTDVPLSQPAYMCAIVAGMTVHKIVEWCAAIPQCHLHYDAIRPQLIKFVT